MTILSNKSGHKKHSKKKRKIPVSVPICWQSPFEAYRKLHSPNSFLLESVSGSARIARYSIIGIEPHTIFKSKGSKTRITDETGERIIVGDPFKVLRQTCLDLAVHSNKSFCGGAVGYFSYDLGRFIEELPVLAEDDLQLPDAVWMFSSLFVVFDHSNGSAEIVAMVDDDDDPRAAYGFAKEKINKTVERLNSKTVDAFIGATGRNVEWSSNFSEESFAANVKEAKEYIQAGDIYQVNLSQRLAAPASSSPLHIYSILRELNPSPFAGFFDFGDWSMVSCSPERLVKLENGCVQTRPIAGTVRRGESRIEDGKLRRQLTSDVKERAEHIMLVDLERSDLGRVCDFGSVGVDQLLVTESYSHVSHIVSNVVGRLKSSMDGFDLIRACFPGGTITGCPKVRAMEIIEELEPVRRGPYTGSMGYIGFNGNLDLNIIIRTLIMKGGLAYVQAGAGIVADSDPVREYYETLNKAEALVRATTMAEESQGCLLT